MERHYKHGAPAVIDPASPVAASWSSIVSALELESADHVEIWVEAPPSRRDLIALRHVLDGRDVVIHGPFIGMSLATDWLDLAKLSLDRVHRAVEFAFLIDAKVVTLHAGTFSLFDTQGDAIQRLAERLQDLVGLDDPVVTLENMPLRSGVSLECLARLEDLLTVQSLLPKLRFTLDVGHALQNRDDYVRFVQEHGASIANIHLHDGLPGGRAHLALGSGSIELRLLVDALARANYDGFLSLETISSADTAMSWRALLECERQIFVRRDQAVGQV